MEDSAARERGSTVAARVAANRAVENRLADRPLDEQQRRDGRRRIDVGHAQAPLRPGEIVRKGTRAQLRRDPPAELGVSELVARDAGDGREQGQRQRQPRQPAGDRGEHGGRAALLRGARRPHRGGRRDRRGPEGLPGGRGQHGLAGGEGDTLEGAQSHCQLAA